MPENHALASQIALKLDGQKVDREVLEMVLEVSVDQHVHLPDMFVLQLNDPGLQILDSGPFDLTKEVDVTAENAEGEEKSLFKGELTALEPNFDQGMTATLTVRGYDKSHRLYRERKTQTFLNIKDSDIAERIANQGGLQTEIDETSAVYEHVFQHNQTDLEFLRARAARIGYQCFVSDEKLHFRKPVAGSAETELTWGDDLLSFSPRMTLAEQVDEVVVKGWDPENKEAITGQAQDGELYPDIQESKNGAAWAGSFGAGKEIIVDQPVISQAEADTLAQARLDELSGAFIEAEGVAFRRPEIRAGQIVKLNALGERLTGEYLVTAATHTFSPRGLETHFSVLGSRNGLLGEQLSARPVERPWPGLVPAVVTNTDDPNGWGRVKVKFPWLDEDAESHWARVIGAGAGPESGLYLVPEVDDEVIVAFEHGDFNRPYVLGGVWNGQHEVPPEAAGAASGEKPLVRTWHSRTGHRLTFFDDADDKAELVTAGGHAVVLDDAGQKVTITSAGGLSITLDDNGAKVVFDSGGDVEVTSSGNMKLQAGANLDLEAGGQVNVKGAVINLN